MSQPGVTTRYPHLREMLMRGDTVRPLAPLPLRGLPNFSGRQDAS